MHRMVAHMKGAAVSARLDWVKRFHGARWDEFFGALGGGTRRDLLEGVIKTEWVPVPVVIDILLTGDRLFGKGDLGICKAMGAHASEVNLPTLYKLFYRIGSVDYILSKAALLWPITHDTGKAALVRIAPRHARYEITGYGQPHIAICRSIEGFMHKTLELTGAKVDSISEVTCVTRGDACCGYEARWR